VDDGSDEACARTIRLLAEQEPWVSFIRQEENKGKGSVVKIGLLVAEQRGFSHALQIDADGQHDISDLPKFLELSRANPGSVVAGKPIFDATIPKSRYYGRYLTKFMVYLNTLSLALEDSMCGYRVYPVGVSADLIRRTPVGDRMDFDVEILVHLFWLRVPVIYIPTRVTYPEDGVSHFRLWKDNVLHTSMEVRLFFGMLRRLPELLRRHAQ
jgi:glycosyltransferase involved in cell wall biosynthesis